MMTRMVRLVTVLVTGPTVTQNSPFPP